MSYKYICLFLLFAITSTSFAQQDKISVPVAGNYYNIASSTAVKVYVRFVKTGKMNLTLTLPAKTKKDLELGIKINDQYKKIVIRKGEDRSAMLKNWNITDTGYVAIEINHLSDAKGEKVKDLILSGTAIDERTSYVKINDGNYFYWGRRGPSVHLTYQMPSNIDAEWFYNEITVPKGNDIMGSYFMANGFAEGYFGIQVNSPTERRVLFSVWSPFTTDDPKSIPETHQIKMLKKGKDVYTGEFGNEGAGGQSYLKYNWKAGTTYKFLLHVDPTRILPKLNPIDGTVDITYVKDSTTTYTAYFFAPELNQWRLIASFRRPKTQTYLKRPHSFLENFIPEMGDKSRQVLFSNQWIADSTGNWIELNDARFTTDNTGNMNYRKDYAGGVINGAFYLRNCGFFSNFTPPKTQFSRAKLNQKPEVNLYQLR